MARELINIGAQDNDGTGDSLRVTGAKVNRMFQEVYLLLNDPKIAAVGQDLLLGSASKIAIVTANMPAIVSVINNMPAILNAEKFANRAELASATAQAFVNGLVYTTVEAGAAANPDGKPFAVIGADPATYATLYQVRTTVTSFTGGAMPAGASVKRAAGNYSRFKRVEYTDYDFASGALPLGVTVQRAAGSWSRRAQNGTQEIGTAANVARFDYDPPVDNKFPFSSTDNAVVGSGGTSGTITASAPSNGAVKYSAGAVAVGQNAISYISVTASASGMNTMALDVAGDVGGEILFLFASGAGGVYPFKRIVLTTSFQRFELIAPAANTTWFIGSYTSADAPAGMREAVPAQAYYVRRRQLNSGPIALAYAETTGTPIYVPPVCRGLMLEPERTNYVKSSGAVTDSPWANSGTTVTLSPVAAPDGTATAARIAIDATGSFGRNQAAGFPGIGAATLSAYRRSDNPAPRAVYMNGLTSSANNRGLAIAMSPAWKRDAFTQTLAADSGIYVSPVSGSGAVAGNTTTAGSADLWGVQLELGGDMSSYIPTTTGPVTRPAETILIPAPPGDLIYNSVYTYADGTTEAVQVGATNGKIYVAPTKPSVLRSIRITGIPSAVMETGSTADTARLDYDPVTGASRGVLVEPARTNYIRSSRSPEAAVWFRRGAAKVQTTAFTRIDGTPGGRLMSVGFQGQDFYENGDDVPAGVGDPSFYIWPISTAGQLDIREPNADAGKWAIDLSKVQAGAWSRIHRGHPAVSIVTEFSRRSIWFSSATGVFLDFYVDAIQATSRPLTSYIDRTGNVVANRPVETLAIQGGTGSYRVTFDDASTQDMTLTAASGVVSIPATALNRYNVMSVSAMVPVALGSIAGKSVTDELVRSIQRIGVYPEQYGAVGDGIADDTLPLQAAADTGMNILIMPGKTYKIDRADGAIQLKPGQSVTGYQPGRSGGAQRSSFVNNAVGGGIFWYTQDATTADVKMPRISNLSMNADYPIRFNDERTAILVDGASSNVPPGKKPAIINCDISARVAGQGIGISWSKMFDGEITGCDIVGFDINVLLNGCDLNRFEHNRSQIAARYHVLELGAGSFGSQNIIRHNDLLAVGVNGKFVQSTGRHRRISDNYIEQGSPCLGFIDCSNVGVPTYAGNVGSEQFTTVVRDNRIDGKKYATQFIYRYQAEGQTYGEIIDVGTSGEPATVPALALVNPAGTVLNCVPFNFNQTNKAAFAFQGPDFGIWNGYRTVETPSLRLTGRNICQFSAPALFGDKASLYLRGRDESLVLLPRPGGSTDDPTFSFLFTAATRLFAAGFTCVAEYVARAPGVAESLSIGSLVDGAGGALTTAALGTDFRKVLVQFMSGANNGCYLKRTQNGGEIEIRSLRIYPLYAQEIPRTTATTATMSLDQIEGLIEVYGEGAGGGAPASYVYGFANNRLVKLGESVTNADALAVTTTQSADLGTLTFTLSGSGGGKGFTVRRKSLS